MSKNSFSQTGSLQYEPVFGAKGENSQQVRQDTSQFNQVLNDLDPNINFVAFIVRPDSFALFRTVRSEAQSKGFQVGWEPFQQERPLIFGSGGRSVGVQ